MAAVDKRLIRRAERAIAMAKAHRIHENAEQSKVGTPTWDDVHQAWQMALTHFQTPDLEAGERDPEFARQQNFIYQQQAVALKRLKIAEAYSTLNQEQAEKTLAELQTDMILKGDWEVWFEHGRYCSTAVERWLMAVLSSDQPGTLDPNRQRTAEWLYKATQSLNQARLLAEQPRSGADIAKQKQIQDELERVRRWQQVYDLDSRTRRALHADDPAATLNAADCQSIAQYVTNQLGQVKGDDAVAVAHRLWNEHRTAARKRLETQRSAAQDRPNAQEHTVDYVGAIDALLGIRYLYPQDTAVAVAIDSAFGAALQQHANSVAAHIDDHSGERYVNYHRDRRNELPDSLKVADLQVTRNDELEAENRTLISAAQQIGYATTHHNRQQLLQLSQKLNDWRDKIVLLKQQLTDVRGLAAQGLRNDEALAKARFMLRMSGADARPVEQIDIVFTEANHQAVIQHRTLVDTQRTSRTAQQQIKTQLETRLAEEPALAALCKKLANPATALTEAERIRIAAYPALLETLLQLLDDMRQQDKDDTTGQQSQLRYTSPDGGTYAGLTAISEEVQKKLGHYRAAEQWLAERKPDGPATIDWAQARALVARLKLYGPAGLGAAQRLAEAARGGSSSLRYGKEWWHERYRDILTRAAGTLSFDSWINDQLAETTQVGRYTLFAQFDRLSDAAWQQFSATQAITRQRQGDILPTAARQPEPYAIAELVNQRRREAHAQLNTQIAEANDQLSNINWRLEHFAATFDRYNNAHATFLLVPHKRWGLFTVNGSKLQQTPEYADLVRAIQQMCKVAPRFDQFVNSLAELRDERSQVTIRGCDEEELR